MTLTVDSIKLIGTSFDKKQGGLLSQLQKSEFSGCLLVNSAKSDEWVFIFYLGRIIYATGGKHSVRRYQRNLSVYLPSVKTEFLRLRQKPQLKTALKIEQYWEYELLEIWLKQKKIDAKQVNQFITAQVREILFDIARTRQVSIEYKPDIIYSSPLTLISSEQIAIEVLELWENWREARLVNRCPDAAPLIVRLEELKQQVPLKTYQGMIKILNGTKTLRELSLELTKQNVIKLLDLINIYIDKGLIELVQIPDLSSPVKEPDTYIPLIACIDDSPVICQIMETIIKESGYRFLAITDELRAVNVLLKEKPDLVFLDYVMPKINGYELCGMLRKVPQFAELPIVILTAHHNLLEQFRGKISGCSNLLYKPVQADVVRKTMSEYLNKPNLAGNTSQESGFRSEMLTASKSQPLYFSV
jgi:chemotaxis family two-component system response regulator PixG